jgi:hypothetical protein
LRIEARKRLLKMPLPPGLSARIREARSRIHELRVAIERRNPPFAFLLTL